MTVLLRNLVIENYNTNMGYVDKSDCMANSYGISRCTWKWTKKLFFHLIDITVLNSYIIQKSCGGKLSHKEFRESLIRNLIQTAQDLNPQPSTSHRGRPSTSSTQLSRLDSKFSKHWPVKTSSRRCKVCSDKKKTSRSMYSCEVCDVALCIYPCFKLYHTKTKY
ncbi:PiggyBac transposable element-derived protein 4 [Blattella germanica]|nr:PiggyBac transposable element-derived protein 4 [Blattella germanica]